MLYRVRSSLRSARNADGAVVLDIRGNRIFNLNAAASELLEMLKAGSASPSALADALVSHYGIEADAARRDVDDFLAELKSHQLIETTKAGIRI